METLAQSGADSAEVSDGLLHCGNDHWYPVVRGIPRMLPDALREHWTTVEGHLSTSAPEPVRALTERMDEVAGCVRGYDRRTRANFSLEWEHHDLGDPTWGMDLDDRVKWFFLDSVHIPEAELVGKVLFDAGCGNGSQSVAYTRYGLEVIAMDISSGLERGHAFRLQLASASPERVHFVQGDLQRPPLATGSVDIIHSAGVLHHTENTERTFRGLCPLLKPGGTLYVWFYKYEPVVTPVVNALRWVTTRIPPPAFAKLAKGLALPFIGFCRATALLGVRAYPAMTSREAVLALMDIFGAPYAHHHSYLEVDAWYRSEGFGERWPCNDDRRGFGVCGRKAADAVRGR